MLPAVNAQDRDIQDASGKPMVIHFRFDQSDIDRVYHGNDAVINSLHILFADSIKSSRIDSIHIQAFSSPEGDKSHNNRLAERRAREVKDFLTENYPLARVRPVTLSAHAADWKALRPLVENDTLTPCRDEILQILALDRPDRHIGELIRFLNAGIPYSYVSDRLLPTLRNAAFCILYMRPVKEPGMEAGVRLEEAASLQPSTSVASRRAAELLPAVCQAAGALRVPARKPLFALKTNLLFDAALVPNIELEIPLGRRWSLNTEYMFPWWLIAGDKYCLQILSGGAELRYWTGTRRRHRPLLAGHFLGLYAGGGKYDLQWKENGYQGEFFIAAGISYGYARRIARHLSLEFSIGIGMMKTDYRHYRAEKDYSVLRWQENGNYTWLGPTKAKISLVWMLTKKRK